MVVTETARLRAECKALIERIAKLERAIETKEPEIDWSKIPIGTPIIVKKEGGFTRQGLSNFVRAYAEMDGHTISLDPDAKAILPWRPWQGGECPLKDNDMVVVHFSDGECNAGAAVEFDWEHGIGRGDIILYAVIDPPEFAEEAGDE